MDEVATVDEDRTTADESIVDKETGIEGEVISDTDAVVDKTVLERLDKVELDVTIEEIVAKAISTLGELKLSIVEELMIEIILEEKLVDDKLVDIAELGSVELGFIEEDADIGEPVDGVLPEAAPMLELMTEDTEAA